MTSNEQQILDREIHEWTAELQRLAGQIAADKGRPCAVVMITPRDLEGYDDVAPEILTEDALNVSVIGWPKSFDVDILNRSA